jgi:hypothetical protein
VTCAEAVRSHLLTLSSVTSLVSGRIWTFRFPQSPTLPAVLVQQISDVQEPHLRGTVALKWARIQIDVVASTVGAARAVDQAVMGGYDGDATGLRGLQATVAGSPGVEIRQVLTDTYRELYDADELKQARISRDYRVWYVDEVM